MSPEDFSVSVASRPGCVVVTVCGDLDEVAAPELENALESCADGLPMIVDLSGVTFISSAGLHTLLRSRSSGWPAIVCPSGNVGRVLEIVKAENTTDVFPDLGAAIRAVWGRPLLEGIKVRSGEATRG